jgi:hypothetical protein
LIPEKMRSLTTRDHSQHLKGIVELLIERENALPKGYSIDFGGVDYYAGTGLGRKHYSIKIFLGYN